MAQNPKDFSIVEVEPQHHARTFILKAEDLRAKIKKCLERNEISLLEVNDEGDLMEDPITVSLDKAVGFSVQIGTGMTQMFYVGRDPEDAEGSEVDDKPMFAFSRKEVVGNWTIGKVLKRVNNVDVDKADYVVFKTAAIKTVPNTTDNYITASLDWLIEAVASDFEDMFPGADDEEFDDGE